jgi:16S rRNA A1518/A1519 N6-dimethyltransferase RsmA/KsgA/DIM1 with predicted DNA glycosylase/AP lyase activity
MTDQRGLRMTFDSAADLYQRARPEYPEQLYEAMITAAGLDPDDRLLEIGCASGKATLPLARRGFRITCVEPGPALAAVGRRNLASFPRVEVVQSTFEDIDPTEHEPFDLARTLPSRLGNLQSLTIHSIPRRAGSPGGDW